MSPNEIQLICDRLDRIEDKLDEYTKCTMSKVTRTECEHKNEALVKTVGALKRYIYIGIGLAVAAGVFVPIILGLA